MSLDRKDFAAFFAAGHDGAQPYAWQERLLDAVLEQGIWPRMLVAPTGAGKTSVIDVHVFAQALTAGDASARRPPRRLAFVVDRRVLVDDNYVTARALNRRLAEAQDGVLAEVAHRLASLRLVDRVSDGEPPMVVTRLRGGVRGSGRWLDEVTAVQIICATPDMWGSRLLFGGYGSSRRARPREAGLLALDSVVIVDEAHLARQLLVAAERVGQLATAASIPLAAPRPLQVVETTATPVREAAVGMTTVGVVDGDLTEPVLAARLSRPKPVSLVPVGDLLSGRDASRTKTAEAIAAVACSAIGDARAAAEVAAGPALPATIACYVNTVTRAVDVADALRRKRIDGRELTVVTVCGQLRPHDLRRLQSEEGYPRLLSVEGNNQVDVVVCTQSLEVGVDLDFASVVTELAAGSALAQRVGRCNRRGLRPQGPIFVLVPDGPVEDSTRSGPYTAQSLRDALTWVESFVGKPDGMSAWALRGSAPPPAPSQRLLYQRPELADAWEWARTSDDSALPEELDLWLSDSFDLDTSVGIVVRDRLPVPTEEACELVAAVRPRAHEQWTVPLRTAVSALRRWDSVRTDRAQKRDERQRAEPILVRGDDVTPLSWHQSREDVDSIEARSVGGSDAPGRVPRLRPGDVVVLDAAERLFTPWRSTPGEGEQRLVPPVVAPVDREGGRLEPVEADDVLMSEPDAVTAEEWQRQEQGRVVLVVDETAGKRHGVDFVDLVRALDEIEAEQAEIATAEDDTRRVERRQQEAVATWLRDSHLSDRWRMAASAATLLEDERGVARLLVQRGQPLPGDDDADGRRVGDEMQEVPIVRIALTDLRRVSPDEELRQTWTPGRHPVLLDVHQAAVGRRASALAVALGLEPMLGTALELAGLHHDDGKLDERFQVQLGGSTDRPLAKSRPGTSPVTVERRRRASGLPARWRHEQLSAVIAWPAITDQSEDPELVARLVATSHGHGRPGFPHSSVGLSHPSSPASGLAQELFDEGVWDALIDATHLRYGVWGCAFLEAVLRAADCQVSGEGS